MWLVQAQRILRILGLHALSPIFSRKGAVLTNNENLGEMFSERGLSPTAVITNH